MKKTILTTFAMAITCLAFAQNPDKTLARVTYSFTHIRDTSQRNNPYTENMLLVLGKNASVYTSLDRIGRDLNIAGFGGAPNAPFKPVTNNDLYFFFKENKFFTREKLFTNYMIEEPIQKQTWKISKDTASFSGIHCKKATTTFKGRNWIAWYATDLPFESGPWKLNGLPGLIIEAYDDKKEVIFQLAKFDNLKNEEAIKTFAPSFYFGSEIKAVPDTKATTRADFNKLMEAYKKDPKGFSAAAIGVSVSNIRTGMPMNGIVHNVINNPIELEGQ